MQIRNTYRILVPKYLGGIRFGLPRTLEDKNKMEPREMDCEAGRVACIADAHN
jgi:hypothetical protein